ncbi:hypothetical protein EIP91_010737 [Steccherinum ochraceum]|uniref:Helicase ATP-binding domain-containing protein n=1 Tax=Steccherinum ochraceum TaxID=92696 RepID=A0A4R0RJ82_9APHY|nr:hypothetical protein EIP91_010737 [Steccherinum ochraceum]
MTVTFSPAHLAEHLLQLLPAGIVKLDLQAAKCPSQSSGSFALPQYSELASLIDPKEHSFLKALYFLIDHEFVAVQCALRRSFAQAMLIIRVYLVPYDLPGVKGRLRRREEKIFVSARKYMRVLLPRISVHSRDWDGHEYASGSTTPLLPAESDDRTMAELYSDLASPNPVNPPLNLEALSADGCLRGMRSKLYPYQRRSVEAMLCRELRTSAIPDPLYIPIKGINGRAMHLQPGTMEILAERPLVVPSKGGILCEELGTGKTVMVLALVLSTLDQLPEPEESLISEQPVLTPLSLRAFSRPEDANARKLGKARSTPLGPIPSLREYLVHYCRTHPDGVNLHDWEDSFPDRTLAKALEKNVPFYLRYDERSIIRTSSRADRRQWVLKPRITFLTSATLVIVPPNLLLQWTNEIHKHCDSTLRVLVVRDNSPLPSATKLATLYDLVLMSHTRFSAEAKKDSVTLLHQWKTCACPPIDPRMRVPDCHCTTPQDASSLLQIRWKRLVVDEGHVSSNIIGNLTLFAKILSVERRWLVTGTPTTNLMGLNFGDGNELLYPEPEESFEESREEQLENDAAVQDNLQLQYPDSESDDPSSPVTPSSGRIWTTPDRGDLSKLANMIGHFLKTEPFVNSPRMFGLHVVAPLMDPAGPRPGSIQVLRQIMEMVMIRHRSEDVEKDILLPRLRHETVLLDLEPYGALSYNVLQAGILINAIDSERTDQDYLFHPNNRPHLHQVVENLSQALFWHTDDEKTFNVDEISERQSQYKEKAEKSPTVSVDDCLHLEQALDIVKAARNDNVWRALNKFANVFHAIAGLPSEVYESWTNLTNVSAIPHPSGTSIHLCSPERLTKLRNMVFQQPLSPIARMVEWGRAVDREEALRYRFIMSQLHVSKTMRKQREVASRAALMKELVVTDSEKLKLVHQEMMQAQEAVNALTQEEKVATQSPGESDRSRLLIHSPLAPVRIGKSTSAKLNYILQEILTHSHRDKFLIFSRSPLTLAYIAESLELLQVKCLIFTSKIPLREREQYVTTFETSNTYRIFLMDLKHGARGLWVFLVFGLGDS